jgi:predicted MFS family arabinose efflux permease
VTVNSVNEENGESGEKKRKTAIAQPGSPSDANYNQGASDVHNEKTALLQLPKVSKSTLSRIITRATVTVLLTQFILFFNQTAMEAILAPLTERYFGFTPFENSLIFVAITVIFVIMYFIISVISNHVQDRTLIAMGLVPEVISLVLSFTIFLLLEEPPFWLFAIVTGLFVVGLPFFFCCTSSLITKLVEERDVGLVSGLLSSTMNLANIAGPLWGGTFSIEPWLPFAGQLGVICVLLVFFTFSFSKLYVPKKVTKEGEGKKDEEEREEEEEEEEEEKGIHNKTQDDFEDEK